MKKADLLQQLLRVPESKLLLIRDIIGVASPEDSETTQKVDETDPLPELVVNLSPKRKYTKRAKTEVKTKGKVGRPKKETEEEKFERELKEFRLEPVL